MRISDAAVPIIISIVILYGLIKKTDVYSSFTCGAMEGLKTSVSVLPQLIGLLVAVKAFNASGAMDYIIHLVSPVARVLHFPPELVPFALLRPVSGSGSLAMAADIFKKYGPDSFFGRAVSVTMGSTETTFYTIMVYFGAVNVKDSRYALICALFADIVSAFVSVCVCRMMF